jgi:hypothetical protein
MHLSLERFTMRICLVDQGDAVRHQVPELWRAHLIAKKDQHQTHVASANHARI